MQIMPDLEVREHVHPDKRRWQRLPLAIPVFLRGVDPRGKQYIEFASAVNVCAGGMLVAARRVLPNLARLSIEIPSAPLPTSDRLPRSERIFKAKALRTFVADHCQYVAIRFNRPLVVDSDERSSPKISVGESIASS